MVKIGMLIADRYEVLEKIGTGGMSVVYKAKDHKLNRFVAIKVLKQEFSDNANFVSKFRVEAQAAAGLMHPNIVNVYDVGDEKGMYYIVMELVDGITLKKYIEKKSRLSVKEAISIAIQVSMGLEAAHKNHIIHRDIKPQNIIISKDGKVKVTDFGIAKAATSNTITSNVMGSVHYTSPEQARGGYSDERSDIYSLGITIFEMLTGRVPFNGETTVAIAIKHIQTPMPSPKEFAPEIPGSVEQIVLKCCEKSPDRRYQSMAELIADLKQSLIHPDDDFVKVINPDEEGATRTADAREQEEIRRFRETTSAVEPAYEEDHAYAQNDYGTDARYPEDEYAKDPYDDYAEPAPSTRSQRQPRRNDYTADGTRRADETRRAEAPRRTQPKRRDNRDSGRVDEPLRKNTRGRYAEDEYGSDYEDNNYDPRKERGVTILSILAAGIIGLIIILVAANKLGLFEGSGIRKNATVEAGTEISMPNVIGIGAEDAKLQLQQLGLTPEVEYAESKDFASGMVMATSAKEGDKLEAGASVVLTVSTGENGVDVPDVTGKSIAEAVSILERKGFHVIREEGSSDDVPVGSIVSQDPKAGMAVPADSSVTIVISTGKEDDGKATMANLVGMTQTSAVAKIAELKLTLGDVQTVDSNEPEGYVIEQSIEQGTEVEEGTTVSIKVSKGPKETTYSYSASIGAPTTVEDPAYIPGTQVYVVLITADGTKLLDTMTTTFPLQVSFTGLSSGTGTLKMSYTTVTPPTVVTDPSTGAQTEVPGTSQEKVVERQLTFAAEE